ncbi:hypothetical protein HBA54_14350 [Pelagibius litoralis]|uniref:DUF7079 domain-containing protein n=1 Tax=Pelagibius litoralis TaxID=374515 RepID=A0A967KFS6_9PROT|nr:hypothetical protein [Pelagibius litoralis]NIA69781.1 hypothetical protein [Pelagibius litoralis]
MENRLPVWLACSGFYLDTELDDSRFDHIARVCALSPYAGTELDRIMFNEVWPAFSANLYAPAGEWAGWDDTFVKERVLKTYRKRWRLPWRLNPLKRSYSKDWEKIRRLIDEKRKAAGQGNVL